MSNDNRLALWKNDKREKQTHPHLKGQGQIGTEYWVSAWFSDDIEDDDKHLLQAILKRYNSKKPFISISVQGKQNAPQTRSEPDLGDDSIPF